MPKKHVRDRSHSKKTVKLDTTTRNTYRYSDGADVQHRLQTQEQDDLIDALTALRNQLTVKFGEEPVQPQDERLALARSWLEISPGAQSVLGIWENTTERQPSLLALLISVLSSLLTILSTQYTHHKLGQPILKTLLSPDYFSHLNSYLIGSHNELIIATLKLFCSMSAFGGGCEKRAVLEGFSWENKKLHKLLSMRRRTKRNSSADVLAIPDIRTLCILFILSFVDDSTPSWGKSSFLEQRHDIFRSIFGGLDQDSYSLARKILEIAWTGIWQDPKIKRTLKVNVFNEATLHHITKLYNRSVSEGSDDQTPADLAHHFLLAICTHPGVGVCFKDRGWYLRETEEDVGLSLSGNDETAPKNARIYNKILAQLLKTLKVNEDPRQQELALRIMTACPELVRGYWSSASLTLEPRLSSKWIANIAFFGNVISLPVPEASFFLPGSSLYLPTPPPLHAFLENIFPSVNTKAHFSRGILSASPLVQHCTALALAKSLSKYSEVLRVMHRIENELEESESNGQWKKRRIELELEARRRVPDFQVVIAFSQKTGDDVKPAPEDGIAKVRPPDKVHVAMLAESSTRLLWLYHLCFPSLVAEARFDVGKLLQNSFDNDVRTNSIARRNSGLDTLRRLHVLRLLRESDQFLWSSKSGPRSYINVLLSAYTSVDIAAIRDAIRSLVRHILSGSILFEHDPDEVYFWLSSLPVGLRPPDAETPDGTPLLNEQLAVVNFLDDCIQLCLKAPYGYIEGLHTSNSDSATAKIHQLGGNALSPLLATVMEQLTSRSAAGLCPSDVLAIVSFVRRLLVRLSGKKESLRLLVHLSGKLASLPIAEVLGEDHSIVAKAVTQEIAIAKNYLRLLGDPTASVSIPEKPSSAISDFLDRIENMDLPTSSAQRWSSGVELIDCVRLIGSPLHGDMAIRLIYLMSRIHRPAVRILLTYIDPNQRLLRDTQFFTSLRQTQSKVPFDWAFIQCGPEQLSEAEYRSLLASAIFDGPQSFFEAKVALDVIGHRLSSQQAYSSMGSGVLLLIADVMQAGRSVFHSDIFVRLKEHLFGMPQINALFTSSTISSEIIEQGIRPILDVAVDPTNPADRNLISPFSSYWAQQSLSASRFTTRTQIILWLPYMTHEGVLSILDQALLDFRAIGKEEGTCDVLQAVFLAVERHVNSTTDDVPGLRSRLPQLASLYSVQPNWTLLECLIARAVESAFTAWIDGVPSGGSNSSTLDTLVLTSCSRWSKRFEFISEGLDVSSFLNRPEWTPHTVSIIRSLIYASETARQAIRTFLESGVSLSQPGLYLVPVVWSWLDANDVPNIGSSETWRKHFNKLTASIIDVHASRNHRLTCRRAIQAMVQRLPSLRPELCSCLLACVKGMSADTLTAEVLRLGQSLIETLPQESDVFASSLLEHALAWVSRSFAGPDALDEEIARALASFAKCFPSIKPHLTDAVLAVSIQNRLSDARALDLGVTLIEVTHLKPLVVNRHLQSIIQHADFYRHTEVNAASRDAVVHLVHVLFLKHPTNTCQPSHVFPLSPIYGNTLSIADRRLLSIFSLFEETRKVSAASLFTRSVSDSDNPLDVLLNLDPASVFRACLLFPAWRKLDDLGYHLDIAHPLDGRICDPVFVTLLVAHVLATRRPSSTAQWVQLFRTNVVSLLIRTLSSRNDLLRDTCVALISTIMDALQNADVQERPHVLHILHLLKDAFKEPLEEGPSPRLPSFTTLLLAHALRGVFYPEHFIYPLTARFLLQRPELDITDVPMLYAMLYSSSDDWRRERSWILKFIADAMLGAGDEEWKVFKRRHTWDLLAGLFQSGRQDRTLRHEILEVLLNLTTSRRITTSLVIKSGLLSWIETMTLLASRYDEAILWMRVLENILDVIDPCKLEAATGGEWRRGIGRCMALLREDAASASYFATLQLKSRIVMKVGLLPGPIVPTFNILVSQCLVSLCRLEKDLIHPTFPVTLQSSSQSRHTSYSLREVNPADSHKLWGEIVVNLWRASMASGSSRKEWDELTPRMLVWNVLVDGEDEVAEWARTEVARNMITRMKMKDH
ncbi:ribosome 60S biogenesis N-terminal-domain-containing protein [Russula dissimulans]|nr:ribosome 60S biogenesis N-terminal-domain-containing protein [Russula dissimulans]